MKAKTTLLLLASTLLFSAVTASAAPAWCPTDVDRLMHADDGDAKTAKEDDDPRRALPAIVGGLCHPDAQGQKAQSVFQAGYDKWSKLMSLTPADWADVVSFSLMSVGDQMGEEVKHGPSLEKRAYASMSPLDQFVALAWADHDLQVDADKLGSHLTETGRVSYALQCLRTDDPVAWAMCQPDIEAIDETKVIAELRGDKSYPGSERIQARILLYGSRAALAKRTADVKALAAKDPGYAKMFEIARATRAEWTAHLAQRAQLLELTDAMDDAFITHSRKAFAGCEAKTWAAFQAAVAAIPAAKFKDSEDSIRTAAPIVDTAEGYLASRAIVICFDGQAQWDGLSQAVGEALEQWPGFRGPRTATETAMMLSGIELDDKDMKLDFPNAGFSTGLRHDDAKANGYGKGTIAAIRPGDPSTIEFKKVMEKEQSCSAWKPSRQIIAITSGGELIRGGGCAAYETVTVDTAPAPQLAAPRYLTAVKPGMVIYLEKGVPVTAAAKGAKVPAVVFGVAVK